MQDELNMLYVLVALGGLVHLISYFPVKASVPGHYLPNHNNAPKREFEIWALKYSAVWMGVFGIVIATQIYEQFDANAYLYLCGGLSLPYLLQPILFPLPSEKNLPLFLRYSFKANLWIAIFSFIGNYWYTHYFYSVLKAKYTMPSHRLNNVPIALFFATHFYFVSYHTFSNLILRKVETTFAPGRARTVLFWAVVCAFSYLTAFMETLTISSYHHYSFSVARSLIYSLGSAFYGIYFIVSFPVFYSLDEKVSHKNRVDPHTVYQTIMEVMGSGMIVLLLLDFCRIALGVEMRIPGAAFCQNEVNRQC